MKMVLSKKKKSNFYLNQSDFAGQRRVLKSEVRRTRVWLVASSVAFIAKLLTLLLCEMARQAIGACGGAAKYCVFTYNAATTLF